MTLANKIIRGLTWASLASAAINLGIAFHYDKKSVKELKNICEYSQVDYYEVCGKYRDVSFKEDKNKFNPLSRNFFNLYLSKNPKSKKELEGYVNNEETMKKLYSKEMSPLREKFIDCDDKSWKFAKGIGYSLGTALLFLLMDGDRKDE